MSDIHQMYAGHTFPGSARIVRWPYPCHFLGRQTKVQTFFPRKGAIPPPLKSAAVAASDSQLGTLTNNRSRLLLQPPAMTGHSSGLGRPQTSLQIQEKKSRMGPRKSSGICRLGWGLSAKLWPRSDFQVGPKTANLVPNGSRTHGLG